MLTLNVLPRDLTELASHVESISESEIVCDVEQCPHVCTEGSMIDTGMDSFELCAQHT